MRTVYLGTSAFAAGVLERLAAGPSRPALVVTRPDRPRGRGRRVAPPPVAEAARGLGIELAQPEDVNADDARARILASAPEAVVVCAFGALVRRPLLDAAPFVNVHPSLLPRWRGAAPIERAIMAGDRVTGVSIMRLTEGLDSGPVSLVGEEPIAPDDTYGTLAARLEARAGALLARALTEPMPPFREQPEEGVTYAEKIGPGDRTLDPARPALQNERTVRALHPHVGARVALPSGDWLGVLRARIAPEGGGPATLHAEGDRLLLGELELLEVQPAGGRPMDAAAYLRGRADL